MVYRTISEHNLKTTIDNYRTGHWGEKDYYEEPFTCPVCRERTYQLYYNNFYNEIVGCSHCIDIKEDVDMEEERLRWRM